VRENLKEMDVTNEIATDEIGQGQEAVHYILSELTLHESQLFFK
jgi:hypothetical protein